jgi:hypothetical protein
MLRRSRTRSGKAAINGLVCIDTNDVVNEGDADSMQRLTAQRVRTVLACAVASRASRNVIDRLVKDGADPNKPVQLPGSSAICVAASSGLLEHLNQLMTTRVYISTGTVGDVLFHLASRGVLHGSVCAATRSSAAAVLPDIPQPVLKAASRRKDALGITLWAASSVDCYGCVGRICYPPCRESRR